MPDGARCCGGRSRSAIRAPEAAAAGCSVAISVPARRGQRWRWAAIVVLAVLLVLQVALADRERFAADARTRPWMERLCGVLACELPPWREPGALLAAGIPTVPYVPGRLAVEAPLTQVQVPVVGSYLHKSFSHPSFPAASWPRPPKSQNASVLSVQEVASLRVSGRLRGPATPWVP